MKTLWAAIGVLAFVHVPQDPAIDWVADYAAAIKQAKEGGKPLLVVFR